MAGVIVLDNKAAFESAPNSLLLAKFRVLVLLNCLITWMRSYLDDRSYRVEMGSDTSSRSISATSEVPQGSNLGPLLFVLFVNDVTYVLPPGSHLLYADDVKLFLPIRSRRLGDIPVVVFPEWSGVIRQQVQRDNVC